MSKAQTLKSIVKKNVGEKPTFGTNPRDPWSAKANIAEDAALDVYLKSRGINPKFATKDQKVAHSKTGQFIKWKRDHMVEGVDKKDTISFDIPLLIRVLEFAREELKSDVNLHKMVERLIAIRGKGTLTMNQYGKIIKEEVESLDESSLQTLTTYMEAKEANYGGDYQASVLAVKAKAEKKPVDMKSLAARMQASYRRDSETKKSVKEETLDETWKYHTYPDNTVARAAVKAHHEFRDDKGMASGNPARAMGNGKVAYKGEFKGPKPQKQVSEGNGYDDNRTGFAKKPREDDEGHAPTKFKAKDTMSRPHTVHIDGKPWKKFDTGHQAHAAANTLSAKGKKAVAIAHFKENTMDPLAATQAPCDCANQPDDVEPKQKNKKLIQMSKSARIIKDIYKRKNMKEETYDHEKEDKSVATYGKKPKVQKGSNDPQMEKPQAAAVLTGGTTLTGEKRDTIEIDPMMKMRKQPANSQKSV